MRAKDGLDPSIGHGAKWTYYAYIYTPRLPKPLGSDRIYIYMDQSLFELGVATATAKVDVWVDSGSL